MKKAKKVKVNLIKAKHLEKNNKICQMQKKKMYIKL